jgi:hypothetical protein
MDVGDWLRSFGLGQYEATFRDNAIGMDILADLTENDLGQIGVVFGDRKRLLKAIASLRSTEPAPKPPIATVLTEPKQDAAEHRPITVMFCSIQRTGEIWWGVTVRAQSAPRSRSGPHRPRCGTR